MTKKSKSTGTQVDSFKHGKSRRRNNPTKEDEGLVNPDDAAPHTATFTRRNSPDASPDAYAAFDGDKDFPQLVWRGKKESDSQPLSVGASVSYTHEKINPQVLINDLMNHGENSGGTIADLFENFNGLPSNADRTQFYQHHQNWTNRIIHGDSLKVMASLGERDGLWGQVQCIFFDPPYGINFSSNWQLGVGTSAKQNTEIPSDADVVCAFRDTWKDGLHSYLAYLRDRMTVARKLLTDTGSLFLQIGDDNVHNAGALLDEIFGAENRMATITFAKTSGSSSNSLPEVADYLLWYAKDKDSVKYRQLYEPLTRVEIVDFFSSHFGVEFPNGNTRQLTKEEIANPDELLPKDARIYKITTLDSQGISTTGRSEPYEWNGRIFQCVSGRQWSISSDGMDILAKMGRLEARDEQKTLRWKMYEDEIPGRRINNIWREQMFPSDKNYVVETAEKVIHRCMLMTTDPGDLVFDPTNGSGTTAYVAEQWGRRWIACDTSRVSLALTRARLMGARYDYYRLKDSNDVQQGFVYKTCPQVSPKTLADGSYKEKVIVLHDQPEVVRKIVRVCGPFTMESLSPHIFLSPEQSVESSYSANPLSNGNSETNYLDVVRDHLLASGVQIPSSKSTMEFSDISPCPRRHYIQFDGTYKNDAGKEKRAAICIGPEHGIVTSQLVANAAREAGKVFDTLVVFGFAFEGYAGKDTTNIGSVDAVLVRMSSDLQMGASLQPGGKNIFVSLGEPDIRLFYSDDDMMQVEILGVDVFDPYKGEHRASKPNDIACWLLDTDYNKASFFVRHAYFGGWGKDPYKKLRAELKSEINLEAWESLKSTVSRPFPVPKNGFIAVKVITKACDEVIKVFSINDAEPKLSQNGNGKSSTRKTSKKS